MGSRRGGGAGPQMCTFGVLGLSCETPAAVMPGLVDGLQVREVKPQPDGGWSWFHNTRQPTGRVGSRYGKYRGDLGRESS